MTDGRAGVRILSSSRYFHDRGRWAGTVDMLPRERLSRRRLLRELVRRAGDYDALLQNGSGGASEIYLDLVAAGLAERRRNPPALVLYDCSWKLGGPLDRVAGRAGIRLLDAPALTYCVLSSEERELFPRTWGVAPERVVFTAYGHTLSDEELAAPVSADGGVFAGGNSLRDYGPLVEAIREAGREAARTRFSPGAYAERLLSLAAERGAARRSAAGASAAARARSEGVPRSR
jgi:hypothetical protein